MKSDKSDKSGKPGKPVRQPTPATLTRRAFIKGAGAAAAAVASLGAAIAPADAADAAGEVANSDGVIERLGPGAHTFELNLNGRKVQVTAEPRVTLLNVLRDQLGLTGTKLVCDRGACGACTVHLDGRPVTSCMVLASRARGHEITTIEGLGTADRMHPVQSAFVANDALQCGFCTPGMVMSIAAELERNPGASLDDIKHSVAGNICRCGTYPHVFKAALRAADFRDGAPSIDTPGNAPGNTSGKPSKGAA
jgi:aerobic-type carbon monoxide dehydrogenase small subunit (CoxS/CutS family)